MKKTLAGLLCLALVSCLLLAGCAQKPLLGQGAPVAEASSPLQGADHFNSDFSPAAVFDTELRIQFSLGAGRDVFEEALGEGVPMPDYAEDIFPGGAASGEYMFYEYLDGQLVVEFVREAATGITVYNEGDALTRFTYQGAALGRVSAAALEALFWDAYKDEDGGEDRYNYFYHDTGSFGDIACESYIYRYAGALDSFGVMVSDLETLLYGPGGGFSAEVKPLAGKVGDR